MIFYLSMAARNIYLRAMSLSKDVLSIIEGYAPYWMGVGQNTFVRTLKMIHPDHVRDIWNDRAEVARRGSHRNDAPGVVAELVDYYCEIMELAFASSYAYVPTRFNLSEYTAGMAVERKRRIVDTPKRVYNLENGRTVPCISQLSIKRRCGITGYVKINGCLEPKMHGGIGRLDIRYEWYREKPNSLGVEIQF